MRLFINILLVGSLSITYAQKAKAKDGPIIKDFGKVYDIKNPDLNLKKGTTYKVLFDIYTDTDKAGTVNPLINTVARFLNMHGQNNISAKKMKVAFVVHGAAAKNVLKDATYEEKYNTENPNTAILKALKKADVDIYVCGQSLSARGFDQKEVSKHVQIARSAMTV